MAIVSEDNIYEALAGAQRCLWLKSTTLTAAGVFSSLWLAGGVPAAGSAPSSTTGTVCTSSTTGALPFTNPAAGKTSYILCAATSFQTASSCFIADRLVASDGLSGTVTTAQTVNTPALTRYTDGVGVEIWLEVYTNLGATSTTFTVSYTNSAGVSGRTGTAFAATGANPVFGRMFKVLLQAGDVGVLSVQSVTLAGTTGTAGSFGVTLMVTLGEIATSPTAYVGVASGPYQTGIPVVQDNACLFLYTVPNTGSTGQVYTGIAIGAK